MKDVIENSLIKVERWVEEHNYEAYDPFDGLCSVLRPLALGNLFAERLLEQVIRQSPLNLRPLLGVKPHVSTKGIGYMAWGYLDMFAVTGENAYKEKALGWLDWLDRNKAPGYSFHSWANDFDHVSRSGRQAKGEPDIVWTGLIGQAFFDAYEMLAVDRHLDIVRSIMKWMLELPRERTARGTCLSYLAKVQSSIHNSNMVGAGFLARAARYTGDLEALDVAQKAIEYSCARQLADGSWYYGENPRHHWIDNFHTAYILDSLKSYMVATGNKEFEENLRKGYRYWKEHFFEKSGRPKYYHNRTYPVDSQCAAQAIDTLANFCEEDEEALRLALKVAEWTIENMQDRDGHFYYRQYPLGIKAKAPMLHWAQSTTYKALTHLLLKLSTKPL
jgi:uncharacterized protein YyaL (SSP411 family)